jgi:hypothetical protein
LISDYEIPNGLTEILHYDYDIFEQWYKKVHHYYYTPDTW